VRLASFTLAVLAAAAAGCGSSAPAPAQPAAATAQPAAQPVAPLSNSAPPPAAPPAQQAPSQASSDACDPVQSTDAYNRCSEALVPVFAAAFHAAGACDDVARALDAMVDANRARFAALKTWERAGHKADDKAFEASHKELITSMMDDVSKVIMRCKDNQAFQAAMKKLPE
jgi:hypothetical protein